jgi:spermidine/putrescine transport system permease protein
MVRSIDEIIDYIRSKAYLKILLLLFPAVITIGIWFYIPFFVSFLISTGSLVQKVYTWSLTLKFSFDNYINLLSYPTFIPILERSFYYGIVTTLGSFIISYPVAYYIGQKVPKRYKNTMIVLFMLPFWVNFLMRVYAMKFVLADHGLLNNFLLSIGIISKPISFLGADLGVLITMVYNYYFFMLLPLYSSIEGIDKELLEASYTLGASPVKTFLKVTFPLSLPGVLAGSVLVFTPAIGEFVIPILVGGIHTYTLGNLIQELALTIHDWSFGATAGIIFVMIVLSLTYVYIKVLGGEIKF